MEDNQGDESKVGIDYKGLVDDVGPEDILLLDDGNIVLEVEKVEGAKIHTQVITGGVLSDHKGINKKGGGLSAPALTEKDKQDIVTAAKLKADYVAVSFIKSRQDLDKARQLMKEAGHEPAIVAKIERREAIDHIEEIIDATDAIMVARGDLAIEVGDENVPALQKMIIDKTREKDKISITATQMMESMIEASSPTRAEVSDVANAVLDGTDAVMLSAESAAGHYPVETVEAMSRICLAAESNNVTRITPKSNFDCHYEQVNEAIASSAVFLANHVSAKAIIALTESGSTARWMSRFNTDLPIFGLTRNHDTKGRMTLYRGVIPIFFDATRMPKFYVNRAAVETLVQQNFLEYEQWVILTSGDHMGIHGGTNKIKVVQVGNVV
jgi:pyruvate kinase